MSRTRIPLNGNWSIAPGGGDTPPVQWAHTLPVPGLVDLATPRYDWSKHEYHWYRTGFSVPGDSKAALAFLRIEQAMFGTTAWVNGKQVGGDIACYTSQEYDITDVIRRGSENEVVVRVGLRSTLPPESAVGKDQERSEFIPGIWGDVDVILTGSPRIRLVQVIPHIESGIAEARFWIENRGDSSRAIELAARVLERKSRNAASWEVRRNVEVEAREETTVSLDLTIDNAALWLPENPFLYELESRIIDNGTETDRCATVFGMREFTIAGGDFFLNGRKILLRGGNIALHRFFSDAERGILPWDLRWVKRLLIDIPKEHNFNFFRNHIGQLYNRWYDIADEHGMLLQNEWQFWTTTGLKEQITREFTQWLHDNWNHPSIVIWDALNECSDPVVQNEIIPRMKKLDPTRPWESVDFVEQHPYIYALGPVVNEARFGFTQSLNEIESMTTPSVVNEFLWWWLDKDWKPTILTQEVIERWLGKDYTQDELVGRQSFLAQELVELFRRMRVDAIQPFVYLSNNAGPTAHWFLGHIKNLEPKPVMAALKNAFAPFGISIELWDRHFFVGESRTMRLFVFNDDPTPRTGTVRYGVMRFDGEWTYDTSMTVSAEPGGCFITPIQIMLPRRVGEYRIRAELSEDGRPGMVVFSERIAHVFNIPVRSSEHGRAVLVMEKSGETKQFLASHQFLVHPLLPNGIRDAHVVVVADGLVRSTEYERCLDDVSRMIDGGGTLVVIEPEWGAEGKEDVRVLNDLSIQIERRVDADKGGYDSYVFAADHHHPLWHGIEKKHLQMFNGGTGGEMVSQHDVRIAAEYQVHARCGLKLAVEAVTEIPYGRGRVVLSRIQVRGRLGGNRQNHALFDRRTDPVAQNYLLNLMAYADRDRTLQIEPDAEARVRPPSFRADPPPPLETSRREGGTRS